MNELDQYVQSTLRDYGMSPWRRGKEAARAITAQVRADESLDDEVLLPIPLEWEHRVSGLVPPARSVPAAPAGVLTTEDPEPVILAGDGDHADVAAELMKAAFDAEFVGDEDLAERRFTEFWNQS